MVRQLICDDIGAARLAVLPLPRPRRSGWALKYWQIHPLRSGLWRRSKRLLLFMHMLRNVALWGRRLPQRQIERLTRGPKQ